MKVSTAESKLVEDAVKDVSVWDDEMDYVIHMLGGSERDRPDTIYSMSLLREAIETFDKKLEILHKLKAVYQSLSEIPHFSDYTRDWKKNLMQNVDEQLQETKQQVPSPISKNKTICIASFMEGNDHRKYLIPKKGTISDQQAEVLRFHQDNTDLAQTLRIQEEELTNNSPLPTILKEEFDKSCAVYEKYKAYRQDLHNKMENQLDSQADSYNRIITLVEKLRQQPASFYAPYSNSSTSVNSISSPPSVTFTKNNKCHITPKKTFILDTQCDLFSFKMSGDFKSSLRVLKICVRNFQGKSAEFVDVLYFISRCQWSLHLYTDASNVIKQVIHKCKESPISTKEIYVILLARCQSMLSQNEDALLNYRRHKNFLTQLKQDNISELVNSVLSVKIIKTQIYIIRTFIKLKWFEDALQQLSKPTEYFTRRFTASKSPYDATFLLKGCMKCLSMKGDCLKFLNDYDNALRCYEYVLDLALKFNFLVYIWKAYERLAEIYALLGNTEKYIQFSLSAEKMCTKIPFAFISITSKVGLSDAYALKGDLERANSLRKEVLGSIIWKPALRESKINGYS